MSGRWWVTYYPRINSLFPSFVEHVKRRTLTAESFSRMGKYVGPRPGVQYRVIIGHNDWSNP